MIKLFLSRDDPWPTFSLISLLAFGFYVSWPGTRMTSPTNFRNLKTFKDVSGARSLVHSRNKGKSNLVAAIPSHRSWFNRNWDQYAKNISHHVSEIFREINNLLLLDPEGKFKLFQSKRGNIDLPYFRAWNGDQRFRKHALLRPALPRTFRGYVFSSAGIKPGEISTQTSSMANLSDLRASVISNGAFKIMLTNDPSLHLRFDDNDEMHPTLFILDSRTVLMIAILDLTGLML